jgi:hypothetical protein
MDDFAASVENDNGVINIYYQLTSMIKHIRLPMAKWEINSHLLKEIWKADGLEFKT